MMFQRLGGPGSAVTLSSYGIAEEGLLAQQAVPFDGRALWCLTSAR